MVPPPTEVAKVVREENLRRVYKYVVTLEALRANTEPNKIAAQDCHKYWDSAREWEKKIFTKYGANGDSYIKAVKEKINKFEIARQKLLQQRQIGLDQNQQQQHEQQRLAQQQNAHAASGQQTHPASRSLGAAEAPIDVSEDPFRPAEYYPVQHNNNNQQQQPPQSTDPIPYSSGGGASHSGYNSSHVPAHPSNNNNNNNNRNHTSSHTNSHNNNNPYAPGDKYANDPFAPMDYNAQSSQLPAASNYNNNNNGAASWQSQPTQQMHHSQQTQHTQEGPSSHTYAHRSAPSNGGNSVGGGGAVAAVRPAGRQPGVIPEDNFLPATYWREMEELRTQYGAKLDSVQHEIEKALRHPKLKQKDKAMRLRNRVVTAIKYLQLGTMHRKGVVFIRDDLKWVLQSLCRPPAADQQRLRMQAQAASAAASAARVKSEQDQRDKEASEKAAAAAAALMAQAEAKKTELAALKKAATAAKRKATAARKRAEKVAAKKQLEDEKLAADAVAKVKAADEAAAQSAAAARAVISAQQDRQLKGKGKGGKRARAEQEVVLIDDDDEDDHVIVEPSTKHSKLDPTLTGSSAIQVNGQQRLNNALSYESSVGTPASHMGYSPLTGKSPNNMPNTPGGTTTSASVPAPSPSTSPVSSDPISQDEEDMSLLDQAGDFDLASSLDEALNHWGENDTRQRLLGVAVALQASAYHAYAPRGIDESVDTSGSMSSDLDNQNENEFVFGEHEPTFLEQVWTESYANHHGTQ